MVCCVNAMARTLSSESVLPFAFLILLENLTWVPLLVIHPMRLVLYVYRYSSARRRTRYHTSLQTTGGTEMEL